MKFFKPVLIFPSANQKIKHVGCINLDVLILSSFNLSAQPTYSKPCDETVDMKCFVTTFTKCARSFISKECIDESIDKEMYVLNNQCMHILHLTYQWQLPSSCVYIYFTSLLDKSIKEVNKI